MKRLMLFGLVLTLILSLCSTVLAEDNIKVVLDGNEIQFTDAIPTIVNSRTMVPMRKIFEVLDPDAQIYWSDEYREVISMCRDRLISIIIDNEKATVDSKTVVLDSPAIIINSRTMVPLRFVAESTGASVEWDNDTRTVIINSKGIYTNTVFYKENSIVPSVENVARIQPSDVKTENDTIIFIYDAKNFNLNNLFAYTDVLIKNGFEEYSEVNNEYGQIYIKEGFCVGMNMNLEVGTFTLSIFKTKNPE